MIRKGLIKNNTILVGIFCLVAALSSCNFYVGLGKSIDLEAPQITITSPAPYSNVGYNFTLTGTCTDNEAVTKVVITNLDTGIEYGNAQISGDTWQFNMQLAFEDEGDLTLKATVHDAASNTSIKSYTTITLRVDETAPNTLSWYVERGASVEYPFVGNGIQTPLYTLDVLKSKNIYLAENKDIPQNCSFAIHGQFYDAMSINEVSIYLKNEAGNKIIQKTYSSDSKKDNYIGDENSIFSPVFYFNHNELIEKDSSLETGIHYLQVAYIVKDDHGNTSTSDLNWIVWYPESDLPGLYQNQIKNNNLSVLIDTEVPLDIFDDDGLKEAYYALKVDTIYDSIPGENQTEKCQNIIDNKNGIRDSILNADTEKAEVCGSETALNGKRDNPVSIRTPSKPSQMYLIVCARDVNDVWNSKIIPTTIADASSPMLFVDTPKNNEKPIMNQNSNDFTIEGYVLGKNPSENLQMVYVPGSSTSEIKKNIAINILNGATPENGQILRSISLSSAVDYPQDNNLKYQSFSTKYNILTDLSQYDSENETSYFFMYRLTGAGTSVDHIYQLNKDISNPVITIESPNNMQAIDYEKEDSSLKIKFKAEKDSGLQITDYKITYNNNDYTYSDFTEEEGYLTRTITKSELVQMYSASPQSVIKFWVKDALGYETTEERTVVLTNLPALNEISTELPNGTYKKDDELLFQAKFSDAVKVIGMTDDVKPRLDIRYSSTDNTPKYAEYSSGSGTNTLTFKFVVAEGAESDGIIIKNLDNNNTAIDLNGTQINPVAAGDGSAYITTTSLLTEKKIKLDGIVPEIENFNLSCDGETVTTTDSSGNIATKKYVKKDNKLTIEITMSDDIQISGNPVVNMKVDEKNLPFTFNKIEGRTLTFVYTVTKSSPNGAVINTKKTCFDSTNKAYIKDTNGNELKLPTDNDADSGIIIDTVSPAKLTVSLLDKDGKTDTRTTVFDYEPTLSISNGIEDGCTVEYSTDNGVNWNTYNKESKPVIKDGTHNIIARQTDYAKNTSENSEKKTIEVKAEFPNISSISVSSPNAKYKTGETVNFTLSFTEKVKAPAESVSILFQAIKNGDGTAGTTIATANVVETKKAESQLIYSNTVNFAYTVKNNDDFQGIKIVGVNFTDSLVDEQNHKVPSTMRNEYASGTMSAITRDKVILDAKKPSIVTYTPNNKGVNSNANTAGTFKIELKFDEPIYKESGTIILQRKGQWGIPAVIGKTEFKEIYDQLDTESQQKLIWTDTDGNLATDHRDTWTGISVGPYKKITNGINDDGSPDTETKFVLDFDLGLFTGSTTLDKHDAYTNSYTYKEWNSNTNRNDEVPVKYEFSQNNGKEFFVKNIRSILESVGYHQHKVDINSTNVILSSDKKTLTIKFGEDIEPGIEWELIIPDEAFRDAAGNYMSPLKASVWKSDSDRTDDDLTSDSDYSFWSKDVATPFIRVDRYSHGFGAKVPSADINKTPTLIDKATIKIPNGIPENQISMNVKPTGYVRVRIDCQTPGATIKHGSPDGKTCAYNATTDMAEENSTIQCSLSGNNYSYSNKKAFTSKRSMLSDIKKEDLNSVSLSNVTTRFVVGDTTYTSARKDYIIAQAEKGDLGSSQKNYEGVFRTVVYITKGSFDIWSKNKVAINIEGGTSKGGEPFYDGFPLKDGTEKNVFSPYSKNMYKMETSSDYVWNSYEILNNDVALLISGANYSQDYPYVSYGQVTNILTCMYYCGADHATLNQ